MLRIARKLWNDESGFIVSAELIFIATILVIGLVAGWAKIKAAVNEELNDVALAIGQLNQTYRHSTAQSGPSVAAVTLGYSGGSTFTDVVDTNAGDAADTAAESTDGMAVQGTAVEGTAIP